MKQIETAHAPAAVGPYTQAIEANGMLYTSGQIPLDPRSGRIDAEGIEAQTAQAVRNLAAVLEAAGSSLEKVVKTTCFPAWTISPPSTRSMHRSFPGSPPGAAWRSPRSRRARWSRSKRSRRRGPEPQKNAVDAHPGPGVRQLFFYSLIPR